MFKYERYIEYSILRYDDIIEVGLDGKRMK